MIELLDKAEDSSIPDAFVGVARIRAAAILREAARMADLGPWERGAAEKFMTQDTADFVLLTNQGKFHIIVRPG